MQIRENGLSDSRERITNPWERITNPLERIARLTSSPAFTTVATAWKEISNISDRRKTDTGYFVRVLVVSFQIRLTLYERFKLVSGNANKFQWLYVLLIKFKN